MYTKFYFSKILLYLQVCYIKNNILLDQHANQQNNFPIPDSLLNEVGKLTLYKKRNYNISEEEYR